MKSRLAYLIRFYLLTILVFMMAKWLFMLCNVFEGSFSFGDMFAVLWHGFSLDSSMALYLFALPLLIVMASVWVRLPRWFMKPYYAFIAIAMALAFVADTSMYPFWHFKLDASWLQYLETPTEAMASVSVGYIVVRVLVTILLAYLVYLLYDKVVGLPKSQGHWWEQFLYLLLIPVVIIGIRGGLGEATTNIGQVYFSQNQFLNHAAVNPIFSFFYSLAHPMDDLKQFEFYPQEKCEELTQDVYTTESIDNDTLLTTTRPDILIVLMESAGEALGSAMPHLQELKNEGIYFSRCYANSWRTDRGTVSALSGYPALPTVSVMKIPEKSRTMPSIAKTLVQQGYETSFLYGGDINFTNMRSYLISTGWAQLTSMEDFSVKEQRSGQWGVQDHITFRRVYDMITHADTTRHHLWGFSTLSSHQPWEVPFHKLPDEVENSFCYLDSCINDFVIRLKQTPRWKNMLIVLVADHGIIHGEIDQMRPLQKNHIPLLMIGGAVRRPRVVETLCNQSDLPAILFGQLRLNHDDFTFSRDVLSKTYTYPVVIHNYTNAQWICDSTGHLLYDFDVRQLQVNECSDAEHLNCLNKAIVQRLTTDFQNR
jgi:phosphoglycerol transferase MdoB-like AlkP superfamily enzyme